MPTDDELIRQWVEAWAVGDRSTEVVQALDRLAWMSFHDPWEHPPLQKARLPLEGSAETIEIPAWMRKGRLPLE